MRLAFSVTAVLLTGCASTFVEPAMSNADRAAFIASLPPADRETIETYFWAAEVDPAPIMSRFQICVDREVQGGAMDAVASAVAEAAVDECFAIVDRLVRGTSMRVSALATGVTPADMRHWSEFQVREQRTAFTADLTKRIEDNRAAGR